MAIHSMTGYGERSAMVGNFVVRLRIQTLNSKQLDLHIATPEVLSSQMIAWRKLLNKKLQRGRISITMDCKMTTGSMLLGQKDNFHDCYAYLQKLAQEVNAKVEVFELAVQLCMQTTQRLPLSQKEIPLLNELLEGAVNDCIAMRITEGEHLGQHIQRCLTTLRESMKTIEVRVPLHKQHLQTRLQEKIQTREGVLDTNRWKQEVLYYLEKMDIQEECVRLQSHITLFETTLEREGPMGKKLGFIIQEMGRETNTIGTKAQDVIIQHSVVTMKEVLEQIREQVRNIW